MLALKHILESQQFDTDTLHFLFSEALEMEKQVTARNIEPFLEGKEMLSLFYEPSTRTRVSFERAMHLLGGTVISTDNARQFSSSVKGETLEDTIRVLANYYIDVIVLRHYEEGAAARAADVSSVPIINAGDGPGQHPTQTLLDLYTIWQEFGAIENLSVALVGDLKNNRTGRSLAYLLGKFPGTKLYFVAPDSMQMKGDIREYLDRHNTPCEEKDNLADIIGDVDVVYQNRIKKEYLDEENDTAAIEKCALSTDLTAKMKKNARIMHALPRNSEIPVEIDNDRRAIYFRQAQNGLFMRMALLKTLLSS